MTASTGADPTLAELEARLRALELENAELRNAEASRAASEPSNRSARASWRAVVSAMLIVVATALVPVAVVTGWTKAVLVDEAQFVTKLAPLAQDPAIQDELTTQVSAIIGEQLDVAGLVDTTFDGLATLDLPRPAAAALDLLRAPAIQGAHSLIHESVGTLVRSDAFSDVWRTTLAASHRALVAAASGSAAGGAVTLDDTGHITLHLGPIVAQAKGALLDQGIRLAAQIPEVDATMTIAHNESLAYIGPTYRLAVALGWLLPIASLALFIGGVIVARRRRTALVGSGIGMIIGAGGLLAVFFTVRSVLGAQATQIGVAPAMLDAVFQQIVSDMRGTALTLIVLSSMLVVLVWLTGRTAPAAFVQGLVARGNQWIASALNDSGFHGGRFGSWVVSQRTLIRAALIVLVVLALVLLPTTVVAVAWIAVLALLAWWVVVLLEMASGSASGQESPVDEQPRTSWQ